jgi:hypothetical protein
LIQDSNAKYAIRFASSLLDSQVGDRCKFASQYPGLKGPLEDWAARVEGSEAAASKWKSGGGVGQADEERTVLTTRQRETMDVEKRRQEREIKAEKSLRAFAENQLTYTDWEDRLAAMLAAPSGPPTNDSRI